MRLSRRDVIRRFSQPIWHQERTKFTVVQRLDGPQRRGLPAAAPFRQRTARPPQHTIFSGIQPTGIPHLGNYLGALRQWKQLQDDRDRQEKRRHQCYFSVVDLHALTVPQDPATLMQWRRETFAALLAIGLTPEKSIIFYQSEVLHHAELMWILSTVASTGLLSRMTQWKSKLELPSDASLEQESARAKLKLGLFSYPVLQAADVLLYRASLVPIGADQTQHIEFARNLASSFNHLYPLPPETPDAPPLPVFRLPKALVSPAARIMSLRDPTNKMSKSAADPNSRILITDSAEQIHAKIRTALTDSIIGPITYDPDKRPGVSNLLEILKHTSSSELSPSEVAHDMANLSMKAFKSAVADSVIACLSGIRERFEYLTQTAPGDSELLAAISDGRMRANSKAGRVIKDVKDAVGLGWLRPASSRDSADAPDVVKEESRSRGAKVVEQRNTKGVVGLDQELPAGQDRG